MLAAVGGGDATAGGGEGGAYYSMGSSGMLRFCYNPTEPVINNGQKCAPTEGVFCPPSARTFGHC